MPTVLWENEHMLALDKPAGLIVHTDGRTEERSVVDWILEHYPALQGVGESWTSPQGVVYPLPGIVHRLDRTTSGVLLLAKDQQTWEYLKAQFKARLVEKVYLAYVYGLIEKEGRIVAEIERTNTVPKKWVARPTTEDDVRAAITTWKLQKVVTDPDSSESASLIEVRPLTGRTHQIRVHMSSIGHPIVADTIYGAERIAILGFQRPALHAARIELTLPSGERKTIEAPLPEDFVRAQK